MDISPTALVNASTQLQQSQVAQTAQVLVLKRAMDIQAAGALALMQALPLATSWSCPVSTDGLKVLDLLGIFNQIDLTVAVN